MGEQSVNGDGKLTRRQAQFCLEYVKDLNGSRAARAVGYEEKYCANAASMILRKPEVQARINALRWRRNQRVELETDDVIRELMAIARADGRMALNEDGSVKPISEWPEELGRLVAGFEIKELFSPDGEQLGWIKKVKFWDKTKSLELLGRHLKMFTDKVEHSGQVSVNFSIDLGEAAKPQPPPESPEE